MPSYKEIYPEKWLRSDHLDGKTIQATIVEVHLETVFNKLSNKTEQRLAASFASSSKLLTINKTNATMLESITGTDDYAQWRNVRVTLQPGRAPNGKGTIFIKPAPPAPAPVHGPQAAAPVHGRAEEAPVHGRAEEAPVHGLDEVEELDWEPSSAEEDTSTIVDPKSQGNGAESGAAHGPVGDEAVASLVASIRTLNQESAEPMTQQQHEFVINLLSKLTGKHGDYARRLLSELIGREVTLANTAGVKVGRYLYDVLREDTQMPQDRAALARFCQVETV